MTKPPIAPVLEHYGWDGQTGGYGAWQNTRCPFHGDRHASARVNLDEGAFHCMACNVSGDVYALVMQADGVDFLKAKEVVKGMTGHDGPKGGNGSARSKLPLWTKGRNNSAKRRLASGRSRD